MDKMKLKATSRAMSRDVKSENPGHQQILLNSFGKLFWHTGMSLALEAKKFLTVWQTDMGNLGVKWQLSFTWTQTTLIYWHFFLVICTAWCPKWPKNVSSSESETWSLLLMATSLDQRKRLQRGRCSVHIVEWNEWKSLKLFGFHFFCNWNKLVGVSIHWIVLV